MQQRGFSLVEVMIVLAIVAVLAAIAFPSYGYFVQKARRSDAINSLLALQLDQAAWRHRDYDYATLEELGWDSKSLDGYYSLALDQRTASHFVATATPMTNGPQQDDDCQVFALNQDGPIMTEGYADAVCWRR